MNASLRAGGLYLVDASPYIYRAYFALPDTIRDPDGRSINAVYGFTNFLLQLVRREDLSHIAVAFDESLTTSFRNDDYPDYKAQRELPPRDLVAQLEDCQAAARALGCATFAAERFEADDLVGTLAFRFGDRADRVVVVSGDKDLAQLVGDRTVLLDFAKDRCLDTRGVIELFGVKPEQITDYLGLVGDAVDNIPGVKGIGKKTAVVLLERFPDLEALFDNLQDVASLKIRGAASLAKKLEADRDRAFLSKRLATIVTDAPIDAQPLEDLAYTGADAEAVEKTFGRLGMESIRERIPIWASETKR